jgi:hypothetical protein
MKKSVKYWWIATDREEPNSGRNLSQCHFALKLIKMYVVHVKFVVDRMVLGQAFLAVFGFSPDILTVLHHKNYEAFIAAFIETVPRSNTGPKTVKLFVIIIILSLGRKDKSLRGLVCKRH